MPPSKIAEVMTPLTQEILQRAGFEAGECEHVLRKPVHVLLALVTPADSTAGKVLADHGVKTRAVREIVDDLKDKDALAESFAYMGDEAYVALLNLAVQTAHDRDHLPYVRPEHLLIALIESGDPTIVSVLEMLDVTPKQLLDRLVHELAG